MAGVSIAHFATKRGCWQPVLVNQVGPGEWLPSISHVSRRFQPWASEADLGAFYRGLCRIIEAVFLCYLETRRGLAIGGAKPVTIGERHHQGFTFPCHALEDGPRLGDSVSIGAVQCPARQPLAYGLSTRPISPPPPKNRAFPPSVSSKIPTPHFHQISLPSALSPHRQDDPVECKDMGSQFSVGVTTALGGEKKGSTTSN